MFPEELLYHPWHILQVFCWLPRVIFCIVTHPFYQILQFLPLDLAVQDVLYFVFRLIFLFKLDGSRWGWNGTVNGVPFPGVEFVDMEDIVDAVEGYGEIQAVIQWPNFFKDFKWSQLAICHDKDRARGAQARAQAQTKVLASYNDDKCLNLSANTKGDERNK